MTPTKESTVPVRFAIVGAGAIANAYGQAFANTGLAELCAVVDLREEAARTLAEEHCAKTFASVEQLLDGEIPMDAAIVCTPPSTHPTICTQLLHAGVHTLCEKPLAIDIAGGYEMVRAAETGHALLTMASKFRYVKDVQKAKEIVDSGVLGDIILWENAFTGYVDMGERWNSQPSVSGGGVLIDNGTHSLDLARFFLGPIDALRVSEGKRTQGLPVEETVQITFQSRSGSMGTIDLSWTINKQLPTYITIHGSEGTLSLGWKESKYRNHQDEEWTVFGQGYSKVGAFVNQIENMANAILGKEDLLITIDDGLASIRAIEAAYIALSQAPSAIQEEPSLGEGIFRVELEGKPRETL